jgi:glucose-6-phosphate dehydrogenase assembly protein OpcA
MTTLWDTTGTEVVKALAAERRSGGAVMSGLALTLVVVTDEKDVAHAEAAATTAASRHPCRLLVVIRRQIDAPVPRLDAEVQIGGRLGPGEAVVMRMYGRLALHAESVVLPLLAPDAPVVTWWYGELPDRIAHDPLGVFAERRVTDVCRSPDPVAGLRQRAEDYATGDTDLAWTKITSWRALLASAFDTIRATPSRAVVRGAGRDPTALLLAGWLSARLGLPVPVEPANGGRRGGGITQVVIDLDDGAAVRASRASGADVLLQRDGQPDSVVTVPDRELGDLLAEELRRLDADQPYAEALSAATGVGGLTGRPAKRVHIWRDPAEDTAAEAAAPDSTRTAPGPAGTGTSAASAAASAAAAAPTGSGSAADPAGEAEHGPGSWPGTGAAPAPGHGDAEAAEGGAPTG